MENKKEEFEERLTVSVLYDYLFYFSVFYRIHKTQSILCCRIEFHSNFMLNLYPLLLQNNFKSLQKCQLENIPTTILR